MTTPVLPNRAVIRSFFGSRWQPQVSLQFVDRLLARRVNKAVLPRITWTPARRAKRGSGFTGTFDPCVVFRGRPAAKFRELPRADARWLFVDRHAQRRTGAQGRQPIRPGSAAYRSGHNHGMPDSLSRPEEWRTLKERSRQRRKFFADCNLFPRTPSDCISQRFIVTLWD